MLGSLFPRRLDSRALPRRQDDAGVKDREQAVAYTWCAAFCACVLLYTPLNAGVFGVFFCCEPLFRLNTLACAVYFNLFIVLKFFLWYCLCPSAQDR